MTTPEPPGATTLAQLHGHARRWALAMTVGGLVLLVLTIVWSVLTPWGQRLDHKAFGSVVITDTFRYVHLDTVLAAVEVRALAVAAVVCLVLAVVRRRVDLGAGALVTVLGANAMAYATRVHLVHRPDLGVPPLDPLNANSAPSGHAVAAASLAVAVVLVTPMSLRFSTTVLASLWASWVALGVIVVRLNRPGDVIASLAVVTLWTGAGLGVAAVLADRPRLRRALRDYRRHAGGPGRGRWVSAAPYGLTLLVLGGLSAVMVMGVLLVAWGVGVVASPLGILLGIGSLALVGGLTGLLVGATSRVVEKYLG